MKKPTLMVSVIAAVFVAAFLPSSSVAKEGTDAGLVGAWRGRVQFTTGAFAEVKDLDFMYLFNAGGTMLESSNYDGAPPVPPAYGVWRQVGERKYQAKYSYYATNPLVLRANIIS